MPTGYHPPARSMGKLTYKLLSLTASARARFDADNGQKGNFLGFEGTLEHLARTGDSFARFGDGEIISMLGGDIYYQPAHPSLSRALREMVENYRPGCGYLIGLPGRLMARTNAEYRERDRKSGRPGQSSVFFLMKDLFRFRFPHDMPYGETQMFRHNADAGERIYRTLWADAATLVLVSSEPDSPALLAAACPGASIEHVAIPPKDAWAEYPAILERCAEIARRSGGRRIKFLLSAGPAAKPMAVALARSGQVAHDVGHYFMALRRLNPDPPAG
jgi:hypothetical protein